MKEPSDEAVAGHVVDAFNSVTLVGGQGIHESFRFATLAGAVAVALGIPLLTAYLLVAEMS